MIFLLISISIIGIVFGYCGWRLIIPAQLTGLAAVTAWVTLIVLAPLTHAYHLLFRGSAEKLPSSITDTVAWLAYTSLALAIVTFTLLVLRDLGWLLYLVVNEVFSHFGNPVVESRAYLIPATNLAILGLSVIITGIGVFEARRRPRVVEITVPIRDLPPSLHGFRIVQICDLHVGPTIKGRFVEAVVDTANELQADLIAVVGDLADGPVERLRADVSALAQLRSRHGSHRTSSRAGGLNCEPLKAVCVEQIMRPLKGDDYSPSCS